MNIMSREESKIWSEIMRMMDSGLMVSEMAMKLNLNESTVRSYMQIGRITEG